MAMHRYTILHKDMLQYTLIALIGVALFFGALRWEEDPWSQALVMSFVYVITLCGWFYTCYKKQRYASQLMEGFAQFAQDAKERKKLKKYFTSQGPDGHRVFDAFEDMFEHHMRLALCPENFATALMVLDSEGTIVYCNPAMITTFQKLEPKIRQVLAQFDAHHVCGTNISAFYKDAKTLHPLFHQEHTPVRARIHLGACAFDTIFSPILDAQKRYYGIVAEWQDASSEILMEDEMTALMQNIAKGNVSYQLNGNNYQGFLKTLCHQVNALLQTTSSALVDINAFLKELSQGNVTHHITYAHTGIFQEIKNNANESAERLNKALCTVITSTEKIRDASGVIAHGASRLSERTENQASSLQQTAASIEEITAAVKSNSESSQRASDMASSAESHATQGVGVIGDAVNAMTRIQESARKISDITNLMDEIAFQTNLLALNASVEAARAGDFGKGFAVVAQEVRSLAEHSAQASKQIKELVESSAQSVHEGAKLVGQTKRALDDIVASVQEVSEVVQSISLASTEQSAGLDQISHVVTQLDAMTQKNASLVTQSAASTATLDSHAQELRALLDFFHTEKDQQGGNYTSLHAPDAPSVRH